MSTFSGDDHTDGNVRTNQYSVPTTGVVQNYEYDLNGNTRFEKTAACVVVREFQWDRENRMVKIIAGTKESQFTYDGESKRVRIRELDGGAETSNQTFVWCGIKPCQKRGSTGGTVVRSYFANGFEEGVNDYAETTDHLGSIREVVITNGISISARFEYGPWDSRATVSGTTGASDRGYSGHYGEPQYGLVSAPFRTYSAGLGRWASRDPLAESGGANLYAYVLNRPSALIDRTGRIPSLPWGGFGGLLIPGPGRARDRIQPSGYDDDPEDPSPVSPSGDNGTYRLPIPGVACGEWCVIAPSSDRCQEPMDLCPDGALDWGCIHTLDPLGGIDDCLFYCRMENP